MLLPNMNEENGLDDGFYPCTINDDNLFWGTTECYPIFLTLICNSAIRFISMSKSSDWP